MDSIFAESKGLWNEFETVTNQLIYKSGIEDSIFGKNFSKLG